MGYWVLRKACRQLAEWNTRRAGEGKPLTMSVNLSPKQFLQPDLVEQVARILSATRVHPGWICLELTEGAVMDDPVAALRMMERLKALGVRISMDDFGTGYSSLSYLHLLPVDVVKIDRSFVSQVESSLHHRVLVEATILVARSLGMLTVAEGVETSGQAAVLGRLLCDKGQGYLFARPLAADDATRWLQQHAGNGNAVERVA
jgi:EAL domain-containing protein (putative c-di-GMP-specific phosphodiesterase class I)